MITWILFNRELFEEFQTGTLLKTSDGKIYLVGDINNSLGCCECCSLTMGEPKVEYYSFDLVEKIDSIIKDIK